MGSDGVVIALIGMISAGVGGAAAWIWNLIGKLQDRIATLEKTVSECVEFRIRAATECGRLTAQVAILQRTLENERNVQLIAGSPTVRIVADINGTILNCSRNVVDILGFERSRLIGQSAEVMIPDDLREQHHTSLLRRAADPAIRAEAVSLRNRPVKHGVGGVIQCKIMLSEVQDEHGVKQFVVEITPMT